MSLHRLVAALGGDLYAGGARANVPAPGHSPADRSVSLRLVGDRVLIHGFGAADWRTVRDDLNRLGLVDRAGRLAPVAGGRAGNPTPPAPGPDRAARIATAWRLWDAAARIAPASLSARHLAGRAIGLDPARLDALRHHPAAPLSVYREGRAHRPAMLAAIRTPAGRLSAVELVYLAPGGRRDERLRLPRKTVGVLPPGAAVRLGLASGALVVGEGVMSVLSACEALGRPGWALLSAQNLAAWTPPPEIDQVIIAADRGGPGEAAAAALHARLCARGLEVSIRLPPGGFEDWNARAMAQRRKEGG